MSDRCGACAHPKQWSGPSHFEWCLVSKHPDLPYWYRKRWVLDDHDLRYEEMAGK